MMLSELTTVPPAALPIQGFKNHLRLGSGFTDDGLQDDILDGFLRAAIAAIEARTGKVLIEREFGWTLTEWRDENRQPLPLAPVSSIVRMTLKTRAGDEILIPSHRYELQPDDQRPSLAATGSCLPSIPGGGSLTIEMVAGYGPDWSDLPADLRQAVMMLAAHFYEYRHESALHGGTMPFGVSALIERYRTVRLFMGGGL